MDLNSDQGHDDFSEDIRDLAPHNEGQLSQLANNILKVAFNVALFDTVFGIGSPDDLRSHCNDLRWFFFNPLYFVLVGAIQ